MKPDYILKWMTAAAGHLKNGDSRNAAEIIEAMKEEAAAEIRRAEAKNGGKLSRQKAAERVIKSAKASQPFRESFHGSWTDAAGRQCLCDGFRAYRLREALPLETIPEKETPFDLNRIITKNDGETLALPDVAELRAYIKEEKARKKAIKDKTAPTWDFGDGLPLVNAQFLLDALELLPGCSATISSRSPLVNPIYFESVHGCGILCPIRKEARA